MAGKKGNMKGKKAQKDSDSSSEEVQMKKPIKEEVKPKGRSGERAEEKKAAPVIKNKSKEKPRKHSESSASGTEYAPPKRALSAYNIFGSAIRPDIQKANPDADGKEMMSLIGTAWKKTSESERKPYNEMAEKDKARYERQCSEYEQFGKFYDEKGAVVKIPIKKKRAKSPSKKNMKIKRKKNN